MRKFLMIISLGVLASCGGGGTPRPSDIDNACVIVSERPQWLKAMAATRQKWNVPISAQMAIIYQESKFDGTARTPLSYKLGVIPMGRASSAYGYAQAIDSTWKWYLRETGNNRARRERFEDSVDFMGWYMNTTLERNGVKLDDVRNQYLAYHEGHTGYRRKSYRRKSWLVRIAGQVKDREKMYREQLVTCLGEAG